MTFISNLQTNLGKKENISSRFCSETDLEKVFFLFTSRVIRQSLKPEQTRKFECIDDVMYYRSQFMDKTQFMPPTSSTLTLLSTMLRLQKIFNFSFVRMVRAYKVHLHPNEIVF